jgi:queuine/archaeosine tRNA-ribosyltransferase
MIKPLLNFAFNFNLRRYTLDQLPPYHLDRKALEKSLFLTHRWEARSLRQHLADVKQQARVCIRVIDIY